MFDRFVLVALAEAAKDTDRTARHGATQDELADKLCSTPSSVRNALQRLRDRGLIVPLYIKPRKGLAQNYRIPQMTEATRRAVWTTSNPAPHTTANGAPRNAQTKSHTARTTATPGTDADATTAEQHTESPAASNGARSSKRHSPVTLWTSKASPASDADSLWISTTGH